MVEKILLDIDGCVTEGKNKPISPTSLERLSQLIKDSQLKTSFCTGRSAVYVEALSQAIGINDWCICENGAYIYHPITDDIIYHPDITERILLKLSKLKHIITTNTEFKNLVKIELGKEICISLNPIQNSIEETYNILKSKLPLDELYITHSTTAIDITPWGINKRSAIDFLALIEKRKLEEYIGIGDSWGDVSFLNACRLIACPNNAIKEIKEISNFISKYDYTEGVIDIYLWLESL